MSHPFAQGWVPPNYLSNSIHFALTGRTYKPIYTRDIEELIKKFKRLRHDRRH